MLIVPYSRSKPFFSEILYQLCRILRSSPFYSYVSCPHSFLLLLSLPFFSFHFNIIPSHSSSKNNVLLSSCARTVPHFHLTHLLLCSCVRAVPLLDYTHIFLCSCARAVPLFNRRLLRIRRNQDIHIRGLYGRNTGMGLV